MMSDLYSQTDTRSIFKPTMKLGEQELSESQEPLDSNGRVGVGCLNMD